MLEEQTHIFCLISHCKATLIYPVNAQIALYMTHTYIHTQIHTSSCQKYSTTAVTLWFYISGQAAKSNIFNVRLTEPNKKNLSVFRLVALMLGSQWNGCITVKKCNPFTVMPSRYWEIHNICDIIYIISHHLLSETFTVLSRLCSFTRNSVLFRYIYKTVIHLFYFYTIKCVCVCARASVRFQSSELSRTHEGRKLRAL